MRFDLCFCNLRPLAPVLVVSFLLANCSPKIQGWSQEAYRTPHFDMRSLNEEALALLPVIVVAAEHVKEPGRASHIPSAPYTPQVELGKQGEDKTSATTDAYRISLSEALLSRLKSGWPGVRIISPGDCLKRLNDAGLTASYVKFDRNFSRLGAEGAVLKEFGHALDCRYLFISEAVVADVKSEASVTVVWTFGRKSVLRSVKISGQIWDAVTGLQAWEGSGIGYNRLGAYERAPLTEDMVNEAVKRLIEAFVP